MGKLLREFCFCILFIVPPALAQSAPRSLGPVAAAGVTTTFVNSGWANDEQVLASTLSIRADRLAHKTGFKFARSWKPKVSLEWRVASVDADVDALYLPETQTLYLPIRIIYEANERLKSGADGINPETAANDEQLGELLDHELGHELMDQLSRRNGLGPWFSRARFDAATDPERLGLDILSEGTAVFFQRVNYPRDDSGLSEGAFPASRDQQALYNYKMVAYDGGYWLVRDILSRYRERGLVWMMRHPFVATDGMRAAAIAYRQTALRELAKQHD